MGHCPLSPVRADIGPLSPVCVTLVPSHPCVLTLALTHLLFSNIGRLLNVTYFLLFVVCSSSLQLPQSTSQFALLMAHVPSRLALVT